MIIDHPNKNFNISKSGSIIEYIVATIAIRQPKARKFPFTYCEEGSDTGIEIIENIGNHAAVPMRYCPYRRPAISINSNAALSGTFTDSPSSSVHSGHNSQHGKQKQTFSSRSRNGSIPGDLHRSQQRSSFSFLLSRIYRYYSLIALKYAKVGNVNIRMVVLLGR